MSAIPQTYNTEQDMQCSPDMAGLFLKMARVMGDLHGISKDGTNKFHNYDYVSADGIANLVRPVMAKHGLAFFYTMTRVETFETSYMVHYRMTIADGESGGMLHSHIAQDVQHTNRKGNQDDKALGKAHTIAQKYFLMRTFLLGASDDEDSDGDEQATAPRGNRQQPQRTSTAAPTPARPADEQVKLVAVVKDGDVYTLKGIYRGKGRYAQVTGLDLFNEAGINTSQWNKGTSTNPHPLPEYDAVFQATQHTGTRLNTDGWQRSVMVVSPKPDADDTIAHATIAKHDKNAERTIGRDREPDMPKVASRQDVNDLYDGEMLEVIRFERLDGAKGARWGDAVMQTPGKDEPDLHVQVYIETIRELEALTGVTVGTADTITPDQQLIATLEKRGKNSGLRIAAKSLDLLNTVIGELGDPEQAVS